MSKVAIGKTRIERNQSVARRMWKFYMRHGGPRQFMWTGMRDWEAMQRSK